MCAFAFPMNVHAFWRLCTRVNWVHLAKTNTAGQCSAALKTIRESVASTSHREAHRVFKRKTNLEWETVEGTWDKQEEMRRRHSKTNMRIYYVCCLGETEKIETIQRSSVKNVYSAIDEGKKILSVFYWLFRRVDLSALFACRSVPWGELRGHLEERECYLNHMCEF